MHLLDGENKIISVERLVNINNLQYFFEIKKHIKNNEINDKLILQNCNLLFFSTFLPKL